MMFGASLHPTPKTIYCHSFLFHVLIKFKLCIDAICIFDKNVIDTIRETERRGKNLENTDLVLVLVSILLYIWAASTFLIDSMSIKRYIYIPKDDQEQQF